MQDRRKQNNSIAVDMSFLLTACLLVFSCVFFSSAKANATENEISEVYIEASGNNKHEAKIKAHERGMQRALYLLANKFNIP